MSNSDLFYVEIKFHYHCQAICDAVCTFCEIKNFKHFGLTFLPQDQTRRRAKGCPPIYQKHNRDHGEKVEDD